MRDRIDHGVTDGSISRLTYEQADMSSIGNGWQYRTTVCEGLESAAFPSLYALAGPTHIACTGCETADVDRWWMFRSLSHMPESIVLGAVSPAYEWIAVELLNDRRSTLAVHTKTTADLFVPLPFLESPYLFPCFLPHDALRASAAYGPSCITDGYRLYSNGY